MWDYMSLDRRLSTLSLSNHHISAEVKSHLNFISRETKQTLTRAGQFRVHCAVRLMKVLVIGGYGAFGARIVRRLKRIRNLEVITAGRNPVKADVCLDVKHDESMIKQFSELKPHLVIHTAGPFESSEGYSVAKACLSTSNTAHKCHYLDLADCTEYVMGFGVLDAEARKKGCLLITGASTTPAITTVRLRVI